LSAATTFLQHLAESCADDSFVRLSLTSPTRAAAPLQRILGRLIRVANVASPHAARSACGVTENVPRRRRSPAEQRPAPGSRAPLATTRGDWQLQQGRDGELRLIRHTHAAAAHDEAKRPCSANGDAVVAGLGIPIQNRRALASTTRSRASPRSCNLARDAGFAVAAAKNAAPLSVVDGRHVEPFQRSITRRTDWVVPPTTFGRRSALWQS
jgi:hypothetical protein